MRRVTLLGLLLCALGFATTISLAWLGTMLARDAEAGPTTRKWDVTLGRHNAWPVHTASDPLLTVRDVGSSIVHLDRLDPVDVPPWSRARTSPGPFRRIAVEHEAGWPRRCLRITWSRPICDERSVPGEWTIHSGIEITPFGDPRPRPRGRPFDLAPTNTLAYHALPLIPLWRGLATNTLSFTLLWACLLWACFALPGVLIRARRRRAGRCAECTYDLRKNSTTPCPECGHATNASSPLIRPPLLAAATAALLLVTLATAALSTNRALAADRLTTFQRALIDDDIQRMAKAIDDGTDVDAPIPSVPGLSAHFVGNPLEVATRIGRIDTVRTLLDAGADPDAGLAGRQRTPMVTALRDERADICRLLLDAGADPLHEDGWGQCALALAYKTRDTELVDDMWRSAAPRTDEPIGGAVLALAVMHAPASVTGLLSRYQFDEYELHLAFSKALGQREHELAEQIFAHQTGVFPYDLEFAARWGTPRIKALVVEHFRRHGSDTEELIRAIRRDQPKTLRALLDNATDPMTTCWDGRTPLEYAEALGRDQCAQLLRQAIRDSTTNPTDQTP